MVLVFSEQVFPLSFARTCKALLFKSFYAKLDTHSPEMAAFQGDRKDRTLEVEIDDVTPQNIEQLKTINVNTLPGECCIAFLASYSSFL